MVKLVTRKNGTKTEKPPLDIAAAASILLSVNCGRQKKRKITIDDDEKVAESYAAASKLLSTVNDALLLEILIRIPDWRSLIQCTSVCKRWFSLISFGKYSFIRTRFIDHYQHQLYTIVFNWEITKPIFQLIFSEKSKILRGKSSLDTSSYLSFLPWSDDGIIVGSSKDLLLVKIAIEENYYICNPFTRQWLRLPKAPPNNAYMCGLVVCDPDPKSSLNSTTTRYRVVLMDRYSSENATRVTTFCSETGKWKELRHLFSNFKWPTRRRAVANKGILYFLHGLLETKGIVAFDPFKAPDHPKAYRLIQFPVGFGMRWRAYDVNVHIGVVQGQLRLSQMFRITKVGFVLRIWELVSYDCDDDDDDNNVSWLLVHDVRVRTRAKTKQMFVAAFHPVNGDMIFLSRDLTIYQYEIMEEESEKVGQIPSLSKYKFYNAPNDFTLVHPLWPTTIPSLPSM